jgi:prefoldin subunit 5
MESKDLGVAIDALDEKIELLGTEIDVIGERIKALGLKIQRLQDGMAE